MELPLTSSCRPKERIPTGRDSSIAVVGSEVTAGSDPEDTAVSMELDPSFADELQELFGFLPVDSEKIPARELYEYFDYIYCIIFIFRVLYIPGVRYLTI